MSRPTFDDMFMQICDVVKQRSTCLRRQVGAVAVRNHAIIATGYNGVVTKAPHCDICLREQLGVPSGQRAEICKAIHAEQNLIIQCARHGVSICDATVYLTCKPCYICFKMMAQAGVSAILFRDDYPDHMVENAMFEYRYRFDGTGKYRRIEKV